MRQLIDRVALRAAIAERGLHDGATGDLEAVLLLIDEAPPVTKIGILAHETGDYTAYVAYFNDPVALQRAVDKLNAERHDMNSGEPAQAEAAIHVLNDVPDHVDDEFLDLMAGMLQDGYADIEYADQARERREEEERERAEDEEERLKPVVPAPGQEEIGL